MKHHEMEYQLNKDTTISQTAEAMWTYNKLLGHIPENSNTDKQHRTGQFVP
jgi:hypothetical protein